MQNSSELIKNAYDRLCGNDITRAQTLESEFYTREDIFELEKEQIFLPSWHFTCRIEDIENPNDYVCDVFMGQKIFVLHGSDGEVRAFANVCRHRWSTLLEGKGSIGEGRGLITCPYHRWCYNFKGELMGAPDAEGLERFDTNIQGLHKLRCVVWNGFVFVTLSDETPDFEEYFGDYLDLVKPYHDDLRCVRKTQYEVKANWKAYVEVDMETYHTISVHPGSIGVQDVEAVQPNGQYIGVYHACKDTVALKPERRQIGFDHIGTLKGKQAVGTHFMVMLPSFFVVNTLDSMWWIQKIPIDAQTIEVRCGFAFPRETVGRPDFDQIAKEYYERWDTVIEEDNWIVQRQNDGLVSSNYATLGRFVTSEAVVYSFDKWLLEKLMPTAHKPSIQNI